MTTRKSQGGRKAPVKKANSRSIRTQVPPGQLARLIEKSRAYTRSLVIPVYPDPDSAPHLETGSLPQLDIQPSALVQVETLKAAGGRGKKKQPSASPQVVHQEVLASFNSGKHPMQPVGKEGPLLFGEFNFEFLSQSKANYYKDAYKEIVCRHHVIFCEEIDFAGLQTIGKANGYGYFVSTANTRNQAVGFLLHPRIEVLAKEEWSEIASVQGVPDLRPGFALHLKDRTTGFEFWAVVFHLKSMRGGPKVTSPIRHQQCQLIAKRIKDRQNILLGGDWNCFLDNTTDTDPLVKVGAKLVFPGDKTSTQSMGGRLDGFFTYQLSVKVGRYQVRNFWKNKKLGRSLSDHGLLSVRTFQLVPCAAGSADPDCQPGGSDLGKDNQGTDVVTG